MLGPYRETVPVDAPLLQEPLPDRCILASDSCSHRSPPSSAPAIRPGPSLPPFFAKTLAASASLLLLSASGFFASGAWLNASSYLATRSAQAQAPARTRNETTARMAPRPPLPPHPHQHPQPPFAQRALPAAWGPRPVPLDSSPTWSVLAAMGQRTHDVDTLWRRAQTSGAYTVARASAARGAVAPLDPLHWIQQPEWLEVTGGDPRWPNVLSGLRPHDRILAINGTPLRGPHTAAFAKVALGGNALVELIRDGKLVALRIDWVP